MTTTLPIAGPLVPTDAQPETSVVAPPAAAALRNSRRCMVIAMFSFRPRSGLRSGLLLREPSGDQVDLLGRVALRELVHDRRRALAVAELVHLLHEIGFRLSGQRR